jgi:drug/metabolite transporter (DMT)-like permease
MMAAAVCALPQFAIMAGCEPHLRRGTCTSPSRVGHLNLLSTFQTFKIESRVRKTWEQPAQGPCRSFIEFTKIRSRKRGLKKPLVVQAASSEDASESQDQVSIAGQEVPKENLIVGFTAGATILFSVSNRVLYKMALVPLKDYPFFLAQALTFGYVIAYGTFLAVRYKSGTVTKEMLELPKLPFVALGGLEALGLASGMAAAANLSGASIPILTQTYLVWQLLLSATILKKKYTWGQIVGCLLVTAGVIVVVSSGSGGDVKSLGESGLFWPLVMIGSTSFSAGASIIKEFVFKDSAKRLKGGSVDIFVVNTFGSTAQALFVLLLLPLLSSLKGIPFQQLPTYFSEGAACFVNSGALEGACEGAPLVPAIYVAMNLAFNISSLSLLKQSSAVVASLTTTLAVPLSIWAFTFPLPLVGAPSTLPSGLFLGAAILVAGLAFYNFSGEKQQKELKK